MALIRFDLKRIRLFRQALPSDIVAGKIVYLVGDADVMHRKIIIEVLRPEDEYKAFCADDGCRYGLQDLYILDQR